MIDKIKLEFDLTTMSLGSVKQLKDVLIRLQDYENAAILRDREKHLIFKKIKQ